ncbi:hypothetical protein NLU13_8293 [Sarocladium strictum]|uniref:Uncharacterized protein n=1 Tax=Sarocladium strictum TaxID=5046 RepID=A0AA39GBE0_SARSR|nr:hypothetical protein NLU13_8293 [Sarocladium strictum]
MARSKTLLFVRYTSGDCWKRTGLGWAQRHNPNGFSFRAPSSKFGRLPFRRHLHVPTVLAPPVIFAGLFVFLWCWKCTMLVLFQNTIIYNPFLPPNARYLTIAEYASQCGGVVWREEHIRSLDGTQLALCVTEIGVSTTHASRSLVYILYMQGNASSLPPRLPDISWVLRRIQASGAAIELTMVCVSYRGYWKSHDRPSERGINQDTEAALRWIAALHVKKADSRPDVKPCILLWGQSIGCALATRLAATTDVPVHGLILETPFLSARAMLQALYPQKWLPYRYLWPFLRNKLDSWTNLGMLACRRTEGRMPRVYMIEAGRDELVPASHGETLQQRCLEVGLPIERHKIRGALHNDASVRAEGKAAIAQSILSAIQPRRHLK